ncbi:MAG: GNAT family N-acetyltransferase, partial [Nevskiales bacterium]
RRLDQAGPWQLAIHQESGASLDTAIADFIAVYQRSWKQPEPYPDFIGSLCRMAAARGWLRLGILSQQDRPIAAQLWLVRNAKASIYKLAYDQAESRFSPGSILTATLMEHVIEQDGVKEVDYLTGDDNYKKDWMSDRRERRGIIAFDPRTLHGLLAAARHFGAKRIRKLRQVNQARGNSNPESTP